MSSLVYLGFSIIMFIITYGFMFTLVPMILGMFFSVDVPIADAGWAAIGVETETRLQWLIPLVPTIGIFVLVIKVLMVASSRGRD